MVQHNVLINSPPRPRGALKPNHGTLHMSIVACRHELRKKSKPYEMKSVLKSLLVGAFILLLLSALLSSVRHGSSAMIQHRIDGLATTSSNIWSNIKDSMSGKPSQPLYVLHRLKLRSPAMKAESIITLGFKSTKALPEKWQSMTGG